MTRYQITPFGARVFVKLIEPVSDIEARAQAAGIAVVLDEANVPKPTEGTVVAVGSDPLIQELCKVGDVIQFSKYAGVDVMVDGESYRSIDMKDIISAIRALPDRTAQA